VATRMRKGPPPYVGMGPPNGQCGPKDVTLMPGTVDAFGHAFI